VVWITVVEDATVGVLTGVVKVCVAVAVVTAVPVAAVLDVPEADVVVRLARALAFRAGTATAVPGLAIVAWATVPDSLEASDPACAGAEVDFTAIPIPKPAAIAITSNAPSSHLRRSMFPPSLRPVPLRIVVGVSTTEPVPCQPAR
jgi:hypothetical protein